MPMRRFSSKLWVALLSGAAVAAAILAVVFFSGGDKNDGTPSLTVLTDAVVDHGDIPVGQYVDSVFLVRNAGSQPLTLAYDARPEVREGC